MSVCMSEHYSREGDTRHTDSNEVEEALQILTESFQKKYTVIPPYPRYRFPRFYEAAGTVFRRLSREVRTREASLDPRHLGF